MIETEVRHQNLLYNRGRIRHLGKVLYRKHVFTCRWPTENDKQKRSICSPLSLERAWKMHGKELHERGQRERMRSLEWKKAFFIQDSLLPHRQMRTLYSSLILFYWIPEFQGIRNFAVLKSCDFPIAGVPQEFLVLFPLHLENTWNEDTLTLQWSAGQRHRRKSQFVQGTAEHPDLTL